jgi:hypothetical protein
LAKFGDMPFQVARLTTQQPERDAEQVMIDRLASLAPDPIAQIVLIAITIAKRRATVAELAQACQCSRGKLHYRLQCLRAFTPRNVLAEFTTLHVAWRRGILGWTSKKTAVETGYRAPGGATALDHFVRYNGGASLREMADPEYFWTLIDRSVSRLGGTNYLRRTSFIRHSDTNLNAMNIL